MDRSPNKSQTEPFVKNNLSGGPEAESDETSESKAMRGTRASGGWSRERIPAPGSRPRRHREAVGQQLSQGHPLEGSTEPTCVICLPRTRTGKRPEGPRGAWEHASRVNRGDGIEKTEGVSPLLSAAQSHFDKHSQESNSQGPGSPSTQGRGGLTHCSLLSSCSQGLPRACPCSAELLPATAPDPRTWALGNSCSCHLPPCARTSAPRGRPPARSVPPGAGSP